jgi:hypothetical protein
MLEEVQAEAFGEVVEQTTHVTYQPTLFYISGHDGFDLPQPTKLSHSPYQQTYGNTRKHSNKSPIYFSYTLGGNPHHDEHSMTQSMPIRLGNSLIKVVFNYRKI